MTAAAQIPTVTLTTEADATALVELRGQLKTAYAARGWAVPSITDLLVKLVAAALGEHPALNATWEQETHCPQPAVHVGLAVDAPHGLVVPVLRDVAALTLRQVTAARTALVETAQSRRLSADDQAGGTFTLSNLGMFGVDAFTPLLNPPQVAILGVGRIAKRPAVYQEQLAVRQMVTLSLTFDHRALDGGPAARFLDTVRRYVETPLLWLA
jgi:pyruvate dehydrogenase E2 component (dihydrolipoamide acetyltransferase)